MGTDTRLIVRSTSLASWPGLAASFVDRDHQSSVAYLERISAERGERLELLVIEDRGEIRGVAPLRVKRLPVVGGGIGVIAGGPLVASRVSETAEAAIAQGAGYRAVLDAVVEHCGRRFVRLHVRPPTLAALEGWFGEPDARCCGVDRSVLFDPYATMVLDLSAGTEGLRRGLSANWRRHLNYAERAELGVEEVPAAEGWRRLRALYESMRDRKGFDISLSPDFWTSVLDDPRSEADFRCVVVVDPATGEDLAGVVLGGSGAVPVYVLGASSVAAHDRRAGYLAQWAAVVASVEAGHRYYDLGGVDRASNPGGWQFKNGMRGRELIASPPVVFPPRGPRAPLLALVERQAHRRRDRAIARAGRP